MTNIPQKWIDFAQKYQALSLGLKQTWLSKLTLKQQTYLNQVLHSLEFHKANQFITIQKPSIIPKPSFDFKLTAPATNIIQTKRIEPKQEEIILLNPDQNLSTNSNPKILNLKMIMPAKVFDLGFAGNNNIKSAQNSNHHNLSKQEYLKTKTKQVANNTLTQLALIVLALALPAGSIAFALNNSSSVKDIGAGKKTFAQVLNERSSVNAEGSDLEFKAWLADFNEIKAEDRELNSDPDQDGLTNFEEFSFKTIPTNPQTCGNSKLDGENILISTDPATCKPINFNDPATTAKFDGVVTRTKINYRLSLIALNKFKNSKSANSVTEKPDQDMDFTKNATLQIITKNDAFKADETYEVTFMQADNISKLADLAQKQIVAYPTNAIPGQAGNVYLSGKSLLKDASQVTLDTGNNNFTKLDQLERGDIIVLTVKTKDDKSKSFFYKVQTQNLHLSSDLKQFGLSKPGNSELTIAVPWPDYSPEHRLIVRATLDRVE